MAAMFLSRNTVNRCASAVAGSSARINTLADAALILAVLVLVCLRVIMLPA